MIKKKINVKTVELTNANMSKIPVMRDVITLGIFYSIYMV